MLHKEVELFSSLPSLDPPERGWLQSKLSARTICFLYETLRHKCDIRSICNSTLNCPFRSSYGFVIKVYDPRVKCRNQTGSIGLLFLDPTTVQGVMTNLITGPRIIPSTSQPNDIKFLLLGSQLGETQSATERDRYNYKKQWRVTSLSCDEISQFQEKL